MKPNKIISKYLVRNFFAGFFAVLLMVLGVVMMFEIIDLLRRISGRSDVGFGFVLQMALSKMPQTIEMVFPFVIMIAGMVSFWKVSKSNEFVVIKAAGVSIWGFLAPIFLAAFIVGFINVMVVNPISSKLYEYHETLDYRFKTKNPKAMLFNSKGLLIRESVDDGNVVILQAKKIRQEDDGIYLRDISVMEINSEANPTRTIEAFIGQLHVGYVELKDVKIFKSGEPTEFLPNMRYDTSINIERIKENFIEPEAISFWRLPSTIKFYETSGFAVKKYYLRYLSLWAQPFLLCAMILVAAMFSLRANTRRGGIMVMIVGGVVTGFLVYFMSQVVYAFGLNAYIPAWLAVWSPFFIITLISVSVILHIEEG